MTATATLQRRLVRTKEAAAYLSISDWKLRRLIQEGAFQMTFGGGFCPPTNVAKERWRNWPSVSW
jgi:excisionase family DNA binding protein